jgi:hypothetical protein
MLVACGLVKIFASDVKMAIALVHRRLVVDRSPARVRAKDASRIRETYLKSRICGSGSWTS